eukprot:TRINITY_DN287_c0_g3_i3.p1 TRINITY_DN287_c0_g3~~TRINITY_DN287_c0_g3_i3.p1  ORF type:complete len:215 (-),score=51.79 TRINITY_DN287_c0_g3_i3:257-901(-)
MFVIEFAIETEKALILRMIVLLGHRPRYLGLSLPLLAFHLPLVSPLFVHSLCLVLSYVFLFSFQNGLLSRHSRDDGDGDGDDDHDVCLVFLFPLFPSHVFRFPSLVVPFPFPVVPFPFLVVPFPHFLELVFLVFLCLDLEGDVFDFVLIFLVLDVAFLVLDVVFLVLGVVFLVLDVVGVRVVVICLVVLELFVGFYFQGLMKKQCRGSEFLIEK